MIMDKGFVLSSRANANQNRLHQSRDFSNHERISSRWLLAAWSQIETPRPTAIVFLDAAAGSQRA